MAIARPNAGAFPTWVPVTPLDPTAVGPVLAPTMSVTAPLRAAPTVSPGEPTAMSPMPSPVTSPTANVAPNRSPGSATPPTPEVSWLNDVDDDGRSPVAEPGTTVMRPSSAAT